MAKLKNYEIDAIYNKLYPQIVSIRENKLKELKETVKLDKKAKEFLYIIQELKELKIKCEQLESLGSSLAKEIFNINPKDYYYGWKGTTEEDLINLYAEQLLPNNLQNIASDLRDRIIIANIDGNTQDLIDTILTEYND